MLQNQWYVGIASSQLKDSPTPIQIGEQKIVLFRNKEGRPCGLLDRCCHRGFPLSKSKIKDGNIACGFHGWEYNGQGQCVHIPSLQKEKPIPRSHCVQSFLCEEQDGYVWVWIGDEQKKTLAPKIPEFAERKWLQGSRIINCNYLRALEITFDSPHVYFVHPTHPATLAAQKHGMAFSPQEVRLTDNGCITFFPATQNESDPIPKNAFSIDFQLPGNIRFEMPSQIKGAYMIFFTTPLTESTCRMDWLILNWNFVETEERVLWTGEGREVIEEDQIVLEAIQKAYDVEGENFEKSVEADVPTLTLRRVVKLAEKGEWPGGDLLPKRRVISMIGPAGFG